MTLFQKFIPATALKALCLLFVAVSCSRNTDQMWDDTKSCGRHFTRGVKALSGRQVSSRQVNSKDDFFCWDEPAVIDSVAFRESEFIAMPSENDRGEIAIAEIVSQPRETPGDAGSSIPGIDAFRDPTTMGSLKGIFRNVHFDYNSSYVKGKANLEIVQAVSDYMKSHPNTYIFAEGHCDERGAEAYNLALGARRSNSVRNALIQAGVDGDHIFTISYGTERPLVLESNEDAWAANRRVEFKIYQR